VDREEAGTMFEPRIAKKANSFPMVLPRKSGKEFGDLLWSDRLLSEMKRRGEHLEKHYDQLFDYWTHSARKSSCRRTSVSLQLTVAARFSSSRSELSRMTGCLYCLAGLYGLQVTLEGWPSLWVAIRFGLTKGLQRRPDKSA
jgi:hypothetical protein